MEPLGGSLGGWAGALGRPSPSFVLSPFSVGHLFTQEPWALGVGPGLGTRESDQFPGLPLEPEAGL